MIDEESYSALYLYNALIEYIYFLIILIQDRGPNNLDNVAKHVRFFKKDVYTFIQTFNGTDLAEKVGQMLCSSTSAFEVKDNVLHLTNNCTCFKQIIYEDFLVSKVVDLILRGICRVQDICQNLNFNSIISIKENDLMKVIEYYPYFHFNSNQSVVLLQYHGLIGFEKHIYDTTVNYFQSYFQNVTKLTYNDVKLHSSFIPSCAIKNSLIVFCLLYDSPRFKCKGGKISLRNHLKRKRCLEQVISIENFKFKTPIGFSVHKDLGRVVSNWTGEISNLFSCAGLIQSVVSCRNGQHGVFIVYFHKTALKYACEIGDLRQFLNVRDVVEFDAEFCSETMRGEVFWEATRIKVTNCAIKHSKYSLNLDIEEYMENVNINDCNLQPLLKVCKVRNCLAEYSALEKEVANKLHFSHLEVTNKEENGSKECLSLDVESVNLNTDSNSHEKNTVQIELDCASSLTSNCDTYATWSEKKSSNCQNVVPNNSEYVLKVNIQKVPNKCTEENPSHDVVNVPNGITNSRKSANENSSSVICTKFPKEISGEIKNLDTVPHNEENEYSIEVPKKCFEENELPTHSNETSSPHETKKKSLFTYPNLIPNNSTFLFGVVTFISTHDGIADSSFKNKPCEVFFKKDSICFQNGAGNVTGRGKMVLLFVPYVDIDDHVFIATLVYPLTSEETIEAEKNKFSAQDFVVNHFSRLVKRSLRDTYACNCDISKTLLMSTQLGPNFTNRDESSSVKALQWLNEVCKMSAKTYKGLCALANHMCVQNIDEMYRKILYASSVSRSKYCTRYKLRNKLTSKFYKLNTKKNAIDACYGDGCDSTHSLFVEKNNVPTILLKPIGVEDKISVDDNCNIVDLKVLTEDHSTDNYVLKQGYLKVSLESCSSVGSFSSCLDDAAKELVDDVFYSCESDFDSSPSSREESPPKNKSQSFVNGINVESSMHTSANECSEIKADLMKQKGLEEKKFHHLEDKSSYLKQRRFSLFKHRREKSKVSLQTNNNYCKSCHKPLLEAKAEINIIKKSYIYFKLINEQNNATLAFPKCLIPEEMQKNIKLNMIIKITFAPHPLLNLSHVLYVDFQ